MKILHTKGLQTSLEEAEPHLKGGHIKGEGIFVIQLPAFLGICPSEL